MPEERLLPPFPNFIVHARDKTAALAFLRGLDLPGRFVALHLQRYGEYTGVVMTPDDYRAARGGHPANRQG